MGFGHPVAYTVFYAPRSSLRTFTCIMHLILNDLPVKYPPPHFAHEKNRGAEKLSNHPAVLSMESGLSEDSDPAGWFYNLSFHLPMIPPVVRLVAWPEPHLLGSTPLSSPLLE